MRLVRVGPIGLAVRGSARFLPGEVVALRDDLAAAAASRGLVEALSDEEAATVSRALTAREEESMAAKGKKDVQRPPADKMIKGAPVRK